MTGKHDNWFWSGISEKVRFGPNKTSKIETTGFTMTYKQDLSSTNDINKFFISGSDINDSKTVTSNGGSKRKTTRIHTRKSYNKYNSNYPSPKRMRYTHSFLV